MLYRVYVSKYNKENIDTLKSMTLDEFFTHLESITFYEDLEYADHKDHQLEIERNRAR